MSDTGGIGRDLETLADAAGKLRAAAGQLTSLVRDGAEGSAAIQAVSTALGQLRDQARGFLSQLDDTDRRLSLLEEEAAQASRFDPRLWPRRLDAIAGQLAADPVAGSASWLAAWASAFLEGCQAEADRLVSEPFPLAPEAAWCPDRLSVAPDALSARSVPRLAPLLRYLAAGAPLGTRQAAADDARARALILHARLIMAAGQAGAAELIEQAGQLGGAPEAEVLAARAALARTATGAAGQERARDEQAASLARRAWEAGQCAAAAVEVFYAEHRLNAAESRREQEPRDSPAEKPPDARYEARSLIDALPAADHLEGALDVLVLPVPDEIWLAAAERAVREGDLDGGRRLVGRVRDDADPLLAANAADLRAGIAKTASEGDEVLADLLAAAGQANAAAGRSQRAIDAYRQARQLVPDHQFAALGLADALLVDGWGKPLQQVAGQFRQAAELLDHEYARQPLDADTSWSLMTYSYLNSLLANQASAETRAGQLWQAPVNAARAIAFDPAQAQRWARLSDTLNELSCHTAASVLSSHASSLATDDPAVRRSRIATLINAGDLDPALALLDQAAADDADGWCSAVRSVALQMSARGLPQDAAAERLAAAIKFADQAVRIQPENLWYHRVRADLLLRAGKDQLATEEFEYLWRQSRLDEADGLSYASRAGNELRLGADAVSLSEQALDLSNATIADGGDCFNHGAALLLQGKHEGLADLATAIALADNPINIEYLRLRISHLADVLDQMKAGINAGDLQRQVEARAAQIRADADAPPLDLIAAEFDRAAANPRYAPEVARQAAFAASLSRAWCGIALADPAGLAMLTELAGEHPEYPELSSAAQALAATSLPGTAAEPEPAPEAPVLETHLPKSWFAGLADPLDHEIIKRYVPDARARLRRSNGETLPGVTFRDDARLEPARFRILLRGSEADKGQLSAQRWYCPAILRSALPAEIRAQLEPAPDAGANGSWLARGSWKKKIRNLLPAARREPSAPQRRKPSRADGWAQTPVLPAVTEPQPRPLPALASFPVPDGPDPLTALVAWPPAEVVARHIERAYANWQAAQGGQPTPAGEAGPNARAS